ncbi:hypothetical protein QE152_g39805 [Popillia japonica]|uniref:Uncharacterized protein n=1 Tax=Popillia japonica TaxID=7064 RepID=A0AAW1HTR1_POPJA
MSAVYGPTTIDRRNCDNNEGITGNLRYITSLSRAKKVQILRTLIVVFSISFFIIGLLFIITGSLGVAGNGKDVNCIIVITGIICIGISIFFTIWYLKQNGRLLYWCNKKTHLNVTGGHVSTNPSTDLLVSATYPPVSDVAYQQNQGDTENSRLMGQETGTTTISNEDADRMVESDPRIVLRPLKSGHEEC